jgi:putative hydrolase of the HAD superfamily
MQQIKNIIFDLGGVIINLDIQQTILEFNKLSETPFESIYTQIKQHQIFDLFDKGLISESDFFEELKKIINTNKTNQELITAWNAMLLDFPLERLSLLETLKSKYRLFLLSNTNETHINAFEADLFKTSGSKNLEPFFEKVYYSCRMGMRKPDQIIFDHVLNENKLIPEETLFIDDTQQHVDGACKTGIHGRLLHKNKEVKSLLGELGLHQ